MYIHNKKLEEDLVLSEIVIIAEDIIVGDKSTPGGLEHMGDVHNKIVKWAKMIGLHDWYLCEHEWVVQDDDTFYWESVICTKCACPGQKYEDSKVYWPTT